MAYQEQALARVEAIADAVDAHYLAGGYINDDGDRDQAAVAAAIYAVVARAHVLGTGERVSKAVTRGQLVAAVFPSLPQREAWADQPDPSIAEEVDKQIRQKVWDLAKSDLTGQVQKLVGVHTPGLILCRTKIGTDAVDAVYVTEDVDCITEDFAGPLGDAMRRANRRMSRNLHMAGVRLPEQRELFDRLYRGANRLALKAGLVDMQLMLDAAPASTTDDEQ